MKRIYDPPSEEHDGKRVLVDRLWPRGLSKEAVKIDFWAKDLAPSNELRKWYDHSPERWEEFKDRYFDELNENQLAVNKLIDEINNAATTFLFSSKEKEFNNAYALKEYLVSYSLQEI